MKIAIEGMDGVGKTTIAKKIAIDFNFKYVDKPLHYLVSKDEAEGYKQLDVMLRNMYELNDPVIKSWMIGLGNIYSIRQFNNENIVLDRHLVSNYFWNGDKESDVVFKSMIDIIGKPDMTILLWATPKTRRERMFLRDNKDRDLSDPEIWVNGYDKMKEFLDKFEIPYIPINTEGRDENEVYKIIKEKIEQYIEKEKEDNGIIEPSR